ncbi:MAG: hypothetical protein PHF82_07635, partial [Lutispora sp.]|nr:hypothetical protein [Lutispora sp.]
MIVAGIAVTFLFANSLHAPFSSASVSAIIVFTLIAATMTSTFAATIYTQNKSGNRYTRKATYNTFTMASGAPSGGGGSLADRGTWGMFHSDG